MTSNILYDVIVIGASEEGLNACKQLESTLKIALVSRNFNRPTTQLSNTDFYNKEVIFSSYNRGLLGVTLSDKTTLYCKNIIIAVGTKPIKSNLKNSNIYYNLNSLKASKNNPVVVFGSDDLAATYAITLSKKFKYVYLCTSSLGLNCKPKYIKKIENIANIVHLPNCNIIGCKNDKEGNLVEAHLDTYSSITCVAVVMSLGRVPDNSGLDKRMIEVDPENYIKVKEYNETTKIPNIFAIGGCTRTKSSHAVSNVINKILQRNTI